MRELKGVYRKGVPLHGLQPLAYNLHILLVPKCGILTGWITLNDTDLSWNKVTYFLDCFL